MSGLAYIGTSGWNYKHWRDSIYPARLPQRAWLAFIIQNFRTVEVNMSFYRVPLPKTMEDWATNTPDDFVFALKLWRGITHYRKLRNVREFTERFLLSAEKLPPQRRAPILIQLGPQQTKDVAVVREYIHLFRDVALSPWDLVFEFRHDSWIDDETRAVLDEFGVAMCLHDMQGKGATDQPGNAPVVYVRRHGTAQGRYAGTYSEEQLAHDAKRIRAWMREGRRVYVYFNNDIGGHAFYNARDLRSMVER